MVVSLVSLFSLLLRRKCIRSVTVWGVLCERNEA